MATASQISYSMRTLMQKLPLLLLLLTGHLTCNVMQAAVSVQTEVSPNPVMVGQSAEYIIRFIDAPGLPNLLKPRVDGLQFSDNISSGQSLSIVNGVSTSEKTLTRAFTATREGRFDIPGRTVNISGQSVEIPSVTVEVVPPDEEARSRAFLQLQLPEEPFFVGQAIPSRLVLLIRADLNVTNITFPQRNGDNFTSSELNTDPQRTRTRVDGRIYNAFIWDIVLTPIKAGAAALSFSQSIAIQVRDTRNRSIGFFGMNMGRSESLMLESELLETEILTLPADNRPEVFNGALGTFTLSAQSSAVELTVGEPLTLTLRLSGQGNFDRISAPPLPESDDWKLYPPKAEFIPEEGSLLTGTKVFEYIIIPQSTAPTEIPGIDYAYFDPADQSYHRIPTEPIPVSIEPADPRTSASQVFATTEASNGPSIPDALLPIRPALGNLRPHQPPWENPFFIQLHLGTTAFLLIGALISRRRKNLRENTHLARSHAGGRKVRKALKLAEAAAKTNEPGPFFAAARSAIQEWAARASAYNGEAHSLFSSDCIHRLKNAGLPDNVLEDCKSLFNAADAHQFAGQTPTQSDLNEFCKVLLSVASTVNKSLR
jgi:hypothetical protein